MVNIQSPMVNQDKRKVPVFYERNTCVSGAHQTARALDVCVRRKLHVRKSQALRKVADEAKNHPEQQRVRAEFRTRLSCLLSSVTWCHMVSGLALLVYVLPNWLSRQVKIYLSDTPGQWVKLQWCATEFTPKYYVMGKTQHPTNCSFQGPTLSFGGSKPRAPKQGRLMCLVVCSVQSGWSNKVAPDFIHSRFCPKNRVPICLSHKVLTSSLSLHLKVAVL